MINEPVNNFFLNNPLKFTEDMKTLYELETAVAGNEHPICLGIKDCIKNQLPLEIILNNIRGMATTNFDAIADHLGNELTTKILAL